MNGILCCLKVSAATRPQDPAPAIRTGSSGVVVVEVVMVVVHYVLGHKEFLDGTVRQKE
jgi:hypothetical protein